MKNIKDITLLAFAVIGFYTIITAFTSSESNQPQQVVNGTPESHVWEMYINDGGTTTNAFSINKKTGEVRQHNTYHTTQIGKSSNIAFGTHRVSVAK